MADSFLSTTGADRDAVVRQETMVVADKNSGSALNNFESEVPVRASVRWRAE